MKISVSPANLKSDFVKLKDQKWLANQRIAGKVAAEALTLLECLVKEKTTKSLIELDKIAEEFIRNNGCTPTFLGYHGFPNSVCISVNKQLVHGICTDYKLKESDVVSFDLGATYEGCVGDTALTCIFGQPKSQDHVRLVKATEEALVEAISAIKIGKRLGVIGNAISKCAIKYGLSVITNYGGHSIDTAPDGIAIPHAAPFVSNKDYPENGIRFVPGLVLALEPMFTTGSTKTRIDKDQWTVWCDADMSAHFEHTIFVHENEIEIITMREDEKI